MSAFDYEVRRIGGSGSAHGNICPRCGWEVVRRRSDHEGRGKKGWSVIASAPTRRHADIIRDAFEARDYDATKAELEEDVHALYSDACEGARKVETFQKTALDRLEARRDRLLKHLSSWVRR